MNKMKRAAKGTLPVYIALGFGVARLDFSILLDVCNGDSAECCLQLHSADASSW